MKNNITDPVVIRNGDKPAEAENISIPETPFVNEECGDTMWDAVLEQEEKRLQLKSILGMN